MSDDKDEFTPVGDSLLLSADEVDPESFGVRYVRGYSWCKRGKEEDASRQA